MNAPILCSVQTYFLINYSLKFYINFDEKHQWKFPPINCNLFYQEYFFRPFKNENVMSVKMWIKL